jgi:transcriptional regulator GlxA family with amidase domain
MMLTWDVRSIVQMASEMHEPRRQREDASRSISFEVLDADLLDALLRLVKLWVSLRWFRPAPLIQQEVIFRLFTGSHGPQLRRRVTAGSPSQQIAKAVGWLKQNFVHALHGDELAGRAHMSPFTFRQHFRALR